MLTGKPTGKSPLVRPRRRLEDNIRLDLKKGQYEKLGWFGLGYGLLEGTCKCGIEAPGPISQAVRVKSKGNIPLGRHSR